MVTVGKMGWPWFIIICGRSSLGLGEGVAVRPAPRLFRKPGYAFNGALAGTCGAKPFSLVRERTSGFVRGVLSARHLVTSFPFEDLPISPHLPTPDIEVTRKPRHSLFFESPARRDLYGWRFDTVRFWKGSPLRGTG